MSIYINKLKRKHLYIILFLFIGLVNTSAQYQINLIPRSSPDNSISYKLGFTEISIKYGSPFLKNRALWGALEPYDQVWRAGANEATKISISTDIKIKEKVLPKGEYALFMIPKENQDWVIIFNKKSNQWGAFGYKEEEDALRINLSPKTTEYSTEKLTYSITEETPFSSGNITMEWGHTKIDIPFSVEYINILKNNIYSRVDSVDANLKWVVFLQGAEFLVNENKEIDLALQWLEKSEQLLTTQGEKWNKSTYFIGHIFWIKAKAKALNGDYKNAISIVESLQNESVKNRFYEKERTYEDIDKYITSWKKKLIKK